MRRALLVALVASALGLALAGVRADAAVAAAACPEVVNEVCNTIDLTEVCGPGCYVQIIGRS